ncbi:YolD-like family protein [Bacillus sp. E(2018)]|uniref:YolD-like family protein n=1 Tax=Bacillus sp. E(2018) TaxID=2502239 RepID=UPI0010F58228|nr:YolD-like family protein [Bacillus sp. E(2018)]
MIRDRGNIKWTSLMLPEHVKELRRYINEEYHDVPEPTLDEQQMEEMNEVIMEAMEYNVPLAFTVYRNKRLNIIRGYIHYLDLYKNELRILDNSDTVRILSFSEVKGIPKLD